MIDKQTGLWIYNKMNEIRDFEETAWTLFGGADLIIELSIINKVVRYGESKRLASTAQGFPRGDPQRSTWFPVASIIAR